MLSVIEFMLLGAATHHFLLGLILRLAKTPNKRYMNRPVLDDKSFDDFIKGLKTISYAKDCYKLQDKARLQVITTSSLLKQYRPTYEQAVKLGNVFVFLHSQEEVFNYIRFPLLLSEKVLKTEELVSQEKIQKLLDT